MRIIKRIGVILLALATVGISWIIGFYLLLEIPGSPYAQTPEVVKWLDSIRTDAAVEAFWAQAEVTQAWDATFLSLISGVVVGVLSRWRLHLRPIEILCVILAVVAFNWSSYQPCCVTIWEFVGPLLLGLTIAVVGGLQTRPIAT